MNNLPTNEFGFMFKYDHSLPFMTGGVELAMVANVTLFNNCNFIFKLQNYRFNCCMWKVFLYPVDIRKPVLFADSFSLPLRGLTLK